MCTKERVMGVFHNSTLIAKLRDAEFEILQGLHAICCWKAGGFLCKPGDF